MAVKLKILTLNCWGVFTPIACQHKSQRISAIGTAVANEDYDIVILQEVWVQSDYEHLCSKILRRMPYTHYFNSGNFGSGVCIFSKHVICETFHYQFKLNGYAHKLFNGDWFGGKCVGLAKVRIQDLRVNVYSTHLHAQYSEPDNYEGHRVAQSYELSQFVHHTSDACDLVIVAGDFNFRPDQLGYKVIRCNGNLNDAWLDRRVKNAPDDEETTCDRPDNPYTSNAAKIARPKGIRLDYVMFRPNAGIDVICEKCYLTMQKVPNEPYHYSDHEGVAAEFVVKKNVTAMGKQREIGEIEKNLSDASVIIESDLKRVKGDQIYYLVGCVLSIVALAFFWNVDRSASNCIVDFLLYAGNMLVTINFIFCIWMAVVMTNRELNALIAVKKDISSTLRSTTAY